MRTTTNSEPDARPRTLESVRPINLSSRVGSSTRFAAFAALWSFFVLLDQSYYRSVFDSIPNFALTFAAACTLFSPRSLVLLGLQAACQAAVWLISLPVATHHSYLAGLAALTIVTGLLLAWAGFRRTREPLEVERFVAAPLRWSALIVYFASGFHKLNTGYFESDASCGVSEYLKLANQFPFLPTSPQALDAAIWWGPSVELLIPTLLILRPTRCLAVLIGIIFHLALGTIGYARFSMEMTALLMLFLPGSFFVYWRDWIGKQFAGRFRAPAQLSTWRPALYAAILAVAGFYLLLRKLPGFDDVYLASQFWIFLLSYLVKPIALVLAAAVVVFVARTGRAAPGESIFGASPAAFFGPLLVLASAASPYVGAGTLQSFSMYSNLRTEGGMGNHYLIPAGIQVFAFQRDLVRILDSNHTAFGSLIRDGGRFPYFLFQDRVIRVIAAAPGTVRIVYEMNGVRHTIEDAAADPQFAQPRPWWVRKFVHFRVLESHGPRGCDP